VSVHEHRRRVRFGDCDPAGIVYFPRFFDWFHQAMESWFDQALGLPYAELITAERMGFPCVHTEADFKAGCRLGEDLVVELSVEKLGNSSVTLAYRVLGPDGSLRVTGRSVIVVAHLPPEGGLRAARLQGTLRQRIEAFVADSAS
jgi:4-hydroxybenzoyl-CoA thioesterase